VAPLASSFWLLFLAESWLRQQTLQWSSNM
jgi:hypothetical protein